MSISSELLDVVKFISHGFLSNYEDFDILKPPEIICLITGILYL